MKSESESRSVVSNSLQPRGLCTVHGILQARIVKWVAFPFSRKSSQPWDRTPVSPALQADSLPTELSGKPNRLGLDSALTTEQLHMIFTLVYNLYNGLRCCVR